VSVPCATSASVITPIVFCASLVPCASETSEAEPIWPWRYPRVVASRDAGLSLSIIR
jgi:ABC-type Fe3+-siderophore transport system permease subunit